MKMLNINKIHNAEINTNVFAHCKEGEKALYFMRDENYTVVSTAVSGRVIGKYFDEGYGWDYAECGGLRQEEKPLVQGLDGILLNEVVDEFEDGIKNFGHLYFNDNTVAGFYYSCDHRENVVVYAQLEGEKIIDAKPIVFVSEEKFNACACSNENEIDKYFKEEFQMTNTMNNTNGNEKETAKMMNINELKEVVTANLNKGVSTVVAEVILSAAAQDQTFTQYESYGLVRGEDFSTNVLVASAENIKILAEAFGDDVIIISKDAASKFIELGEATVVNFETALTEEPPAAEEIAPVINEITTAETPNNDNIPDVVVDDTPEQIVPTVEEPVIEEQIPTAKVVDTAADEISALKAALAAKDNEIAKLTAENNNLRAENETLKADNAAKTQRIENAKVAYVKLRDEKEELIKINVCYEKEIDKLTAENQTLTTNNGNVNVRAMKEAEAIVTEAQAEIDQLTAENKQLKAKLQSVGTIAATLKVAEAKLKAVSEADTGDGEDF